MWKLSIEDDQGGSTVVQLAGREYSIGRAEANTIRLTDRNISRRHARLLHKGNDWFLEDLGSYNGCFVNGTRSGVSHRLSHGDLIQLGDYKIELLNAGLAATAGEGSESARLSLLGQPNRLVVLVGPNPCAEYPLVGKLSWTLGRGSECDIPLNHASVSRVHADLHQLPNGEIEAVDRGSANGLRVNGVELERALLDGRDVLELGDVTLKYIKAGEVYVPNKAETRRISALQPGGMAATLPVPTRVARAPLPVKITAAVTGGAILVVLGLVAFGGGKHDGEELATGPAQAADASGEAARTLSQGTGLLNNGEIEEAHRVVSTIPTGHALRSSAAFQEIESRWADQLFARANSETDTERKRALLERISAARSVDDARRERAAASLRTLQGNEVNARDLAREGSKPQRPDVAEPHAENSTGATESARPTRGKPSSRGSSSGSTKSTPARPEPAHPTPTTPAALSAEERAKLSRIRDILKAKGRVGEMSAPDKKRLKSTCRQLGDTTCS